MQITSLVKHMSFKNYMTVIITNKSDPISVTFILVQGEHVSWQLAYCGAQGDRERYITKFMKSSF